MTRLDRAFNAIDRLLESDDVDLLGRVALLAMRDQIAAALHEVDMILNSKEN